MTVGARISALYLQIIAIKEEMNNCKPPRCTYEDIEEVNDNYQSNLEYGYYRDEQNALIKDIEEEISSLEQCNPDNEYLEWEPTEADYFDGDGSWSE